MKRAKRRIPAAGDDAGASQQLAAGRLKAARRSTERARPSAHQVKGKGAWAPLAGALALAGWVTTLPAAPSMPPGGPPTILPTSAPPLAVGTGDGLLLVALGLQGIDWVPLEQLAPASQGAGARAATPLRVGDWPTVSITDLPGPGLLLAGRDDQVRYVVAEPPGAAPVLRHAWTIEGMANAVAVSGEYLVVAGGGGGLGIWHWPDHDSAPQLRSRYPFIGFGRDVLFVDTTTLVVTDSMAGEVVLLSIADPLRPHRVATLKSVSGYVDQLAFDGTRLAFTDRHGGVGVAQRTPPAMDWTVTHRLPDPPPGPDSATRFLDVVLGGSRLIVCSDDDGWQAWHHQPACRGAAETWKPLAPPRLAGERPVACAVLDDGRLAVALARGGVEVIALEPDRTPKAP